MAQKGGFYMSKRRCREELPVSAAANLCANPVCAVILLIILQKTCLLENNNAFLLILIFIACCCCNRGREMNVARRC
jgi:hypothetical protein